MTDGAAFTQTQSNDGIALYAQSCFERLQDIVAKIKSCDAVLQAKTLVPEMAFIAHSLIMEIERGIDRLSQSTSASLFVPEQARRLHLCQIQSELDVLDALCDQLMATIEISDCPQSIPSA